MFVLVFSTWHNRRSVEFSFFQPVVVRRCMDGSRGGVKLVRTPHVFDIIFQIKSKLEMNRWIAPLKYEDNEDVVLHMKWTLLF